MKKKSTPPTKRRASTTLTTAHSYRWFMILAGLGLLCILLVWATMQSQTWESRASQRLANDEEMKTLVEIQNSLSTMEIQDKADRIQDGDL